MRLEAAILLASALVVGSCTSDDADRAPLAHGLEGGTGGSSGASASGTSGSAGKAESGGEGGASEHTGEAGLARDAGGAGGLSAGASAGGLSGASGEGPSGTDPPPIVELCARAPALGTPERLPVSTEADERFGGVTPDERVIAWTVTEDEIVTLYVASRADVDSAFGAPVSVVIEAVLDDQVALSPDGLNVAFANPDRRGFSVISRPTLDDAFGLSTPGEFLLLDSTGGGLPDGQTYAEPVLSGDGVTFFYSQFGGDEENTLRLSSRLSAADPWPVGVALPAVGLGKSGDDRFAPTGVSLDGRTLFLWDGASEIMAFVNPDSGAFEPGFDLGALRGAAPNAECTRLYYGAGDLYSVSLR